MHYTGNTLLDIFSGISSNAETAERDAVQCGDEIWSYGDLDVISTGLAVEIAARYGARPIVTVISENLPYTLALMLAVWKLGGIFAPFDHHAPADLVRAMLRNVSPSCVVVHSADNVTRNTVQGAYISLCSS